MGGQRRAASVAETAETQKTFVIAMMLPYEVAVSVVWILLFLAWHLLGLPYGPG
jgi:p-aminobenzoyl-glutamate transporter AbgT